MLGSRAIFLPYWLPVLATYILLISLLPVSAAEQIRVSGSSTVFPYAKVAADEFHEIYPAFKVPVVESGGSGSGIKEFCRSDDENSLDVVNASRPMNGSEFQACLAAGVHDIEKITFGYDGIVFATNKDGAGGAEGWALKPADIYRALAAKIVKDGNLVDNDLTRWNAVNSALPNWFIEAYIPGEKHGTREVFEEKLLLLGCRASGAIAQMKKMGLSAQEIKHACVMVRKDGRAIDIDGDYAEALARLDANKKAVGVFGLAFYDNNADKLNVATINAIKPTAKTIASGEYPASRPLYFYVKKSHLKIRPGLKEYVGYFLSEAMIGDDGELIDCGLVPAPSRERTAQRAAFASGVAMLRAE